MNEGKTLFAQLMEFVPWTSFGRIVQRWDGNNGVRSFNCAEQFRVMAFAQLTWRESLRDIEATLGANASKLYGMGMRHAIRRSTLADANETRNWRIWSDLAALLIRRARRLYAGEPMGVYSMPVDRSTGVMCDQRVIQAKPYGLAHYPEHSRRIRYTDPETGKKLVITNNTVLPALSICALYKSRWQVGLFFKWIKQHLRIRHFLGNSENAVKTQIRCAMATYVLIAIVKKELRLPASLYTLLQILSASVFEKTQLRRALWADHVEPESLACAKQLILFDI
jgi:hypothetical protein